jgi:hypothetical protein
LRSLARDADLQFYDINISSMDWGDVYYTHLLSHQNGIQSIDTSSKLDLSVFTILNNVN